MLAIFFDDSKLGGAVDTLEGREALQRDLDRLEHWATSNSMKFSKSNCWVLYLGQSNIRHRHNMGGKWLESTSAERDLVVLVNSRLNMSQQCSWQPKDQTAFWGALNTAEPDGHKL